MRRFFVFVAVLVMSLAAGSRDADAGRPRCENTHCGWYCATHGSPVAGYCSAPAESDQTGCIQLFGPDCASMSGAYCCRPTDGVL